LLARMPDSRLSLANLMRTLIFSMMGTLKIGMDILVIDEQVKLKELLGHGGFFKTEGVGQQLMAAALEVPVTVMESAGEGGAWGIALLASYLIMKDEDETLESFLAERVFKDSLGTSVEPDPKDIEGFKSFMKLYVAGLDVERAAVDQL